MSTFEIRQGDCLERLREMPDESVHCVVTSPPYWGLRSYGVEGQLGLEATPDEFVANMVEVFAEVKRVLRRDGTCWLNIGDSYAGSNASQGGDGTSSGLKRDGRAETTRVRAAVVHQERMTSQPLSAKMPEGLKPKDLCMIPARLALALQQPFYTGVIKEEKHRTWLAALVDGEGCIGIRRQKQSGRGGPECNDTYIPYLTIKMSDREPLDRAVELTGYGSVRAEVWRIGPDSRKVHTMRCPYVWRLDGNKAVQVARELYPHLLVKARQAACLHTLDVSNKEKKRGRGNTVPDNVMAFRQDIYEYIKALNQRTADQTPKWLVTPPPMYEPGWYIRSAITWCKRAPMPESVRDRPTSATEKIYLLTKSDKYFYDADAVKVPASAGTHSKGPAYHPLPKTQEPGQGIKQNSSFEAAIWDKVTERNQWNYWLLSPDPYAEAHFATFPREIPRRAILAGTSERGVCGACGAPWRRISERDEQPTPQPYSEVRHGPDFTHKKIGGQYQKWLDAHPKQTTGWAATCPCDAPTVPATVLDCFSGAGTTGLVAVQLGRRYIGLELNPDYVQMSIKRIVNDAPLLHWANTAQTSYDMTDTAQPDLIGHSLAQQSQMPETESCDELAD